MRSLRVALASSLCLVAACAWWLAGRPGLPSADRIIFSHALHLDNDVECETCHEGVAASTDTSAWHLPAEETCLECHDRENNCSQCHTSVEKAVAYPARASELGFSHQAHVERTSDKGCATCHSAVTTSEALPVVTPTMDTCLACHVHDMEYAEARCQHCHPSLRRKPLRAVAEFDHAGDWMAHHGALARTQADSCMQCHPQTSCTECHSRVAPAMSVRIYPEQVERTLIHRGDWLSVHALEARADGDTCQRCHQSTSFCQQCHAQHGLLPGIAGGRVPHPPGYATRGGPVFHGDEARLRIETCASCHDQGPASVCVKCHAPGGIGGNPHPPGWSHEDRRQPMCQTCHTSGS